MRTTPRGSAASGALAALGVASILTAAGPAFAAEDDTKAVTATLEALRVAILNGDAAKLGTLLHDKVSYGHSSGRKNQTKSEFIAEFGRGKPNYRSLAFTEVWTEIVGDNAILRHVWDGADILPDGGTGHSYIAVMQVWKKDAGQWRLLARQSCPLKPA